MVDVNDTNNLQRRLEVVIGKIDTADVSAADRAALSDFATYQRRRAGAINTARLYIRGATLSAERYGGELVAVSGVDAVEDIISAHEAAGCRAAKSINTKLDACKAFWRYCAASDHGHDDYRFIEHVSGVTASKANPGTEAVDPDVILGEREINRLADGADNYRDTALVEFLCDTGARITLATQLKRGDISLNASPPTFQPNPDGLAHKDVATKAYVLHESADALGTYVEHSHPDDHRDAPLFALRRGYDPDERASMALSRRAATAALKKAASAAGIDGERVKPHRLRKAAVARMRLKHDMSWPAIQMRMEWSDASLPRMKSIYRRIDNADEIDMVARELGYTDDGRQREQAVAELAEAMSDVPVDTIEDLTTAVRQYGSPAADG